MLKITGSDPFTLGKRISRPHFHIKRPENGIPEIDTQPRRLRSSCEIIHLTRVCYFIFFHRTFSYLFPFIYPRRVFRLAIFIRWTNSDIYTFEQTRGERTLLRSRIIGEFIVFGRGSFELFIRIEAEWIWNFGKYVYRRFRRLNYA